MEICRVYNASVTAAGPAFYCDPPDFVHIINNSKTAVMFQVEILRETSSLNFNDVSKTSNFRALKISEGCWKLLVIAYC